MTYQNQPAIGFRGAFVAALLTASSILWVSPCCQAQTTPDLPAGVQDVVKLTKAGLSEDVILAQVRNSGTTYKLSTDQLIYLNGQGVSQNVIKALMQNGASAAPAAPAPTPVPITPPPTAPTPAPVPAPTITAPLVPGGPTAPSAPIAPVAPAVPVAAPGTPVSYDYFHDQLAPSGTWIDLPGFGPCWRPTVAAADPFWRPYCDRGYWTYTDSGWYWQSEYPWGQIAFHYGRWLRADVGWVWLPGYDWAPAWVCWRQAEGHCGWAPLPPAAVFKAGVGLSFGGRVGVDLDFGLGLEAFTFVPYDHFWDHNLHAFILPRDRVEFVFGHSVVMNGYRFDHGRFVVEGLGRERIGLVTHRDVRVETVVHDGHVVERVEERPRGFDRGGPDRDRRDRRDRF